jgi:hypothetical protein
MSSEGFDSLDCPGCGELTTECTCPTIAEEFIPVYEALIAHYK